MNILLIVLLLAVTVVAYEQRRTVNRASSKSKSSLKSNSRQASKLSSRSSPSSMLVNIKNEFVYCYDTLAKAKNNEERIEAAKVIALRHSGTLMGGAGAILLYKAITRKR